MLQVCVCVCACCTLLHLWASSYCLNGTYSVQDFNWIELSLVQVVLRQCDCLRERDSPRPHLHGAQRRHQVYSISSSVLFCFLFAFALLQLVLRWRTLSCSEQPDLASPVMFDWKSSCKASTTAVRAENAATSVVWYGLIKWSLKVCHQRLRPEPVINLRKWGPAGFQPTSELAD